MNWTHAILTVVALFVILEIYATVTEGRARHSKLPMIQVVADEHLGYRPLPGDTHFAYGQPVTLNDLGLRGPSPPVTARNLVIALGETQLYGLGVADDDLATTIAARRLNAEGLRTDVLNAGVRFFSLAQQARLLDEFCETLQPSHIVVFIYPFSIRNHPLRLKPLPPETLEPYTFDLGGRAEGLQLAKWRARETLRYSAAIAWTWYRIKEWRRGRGEWGAILGGVGEPAAKLPYEMTAQAAGYIAALAAAKNATLTFVALPAPSQLVADDPPTGFQDWLAGVSAETSAGYVDLTLPLKRLYIADSRLPTAPYDDHYDAGAHRVMATAIIDTVRSYRASTPP